MIQAPQLPRFQPSSVKEPDKAWAQWIFVSGQQLNAERITNLLQGLDK